MITSTKVTTLTKLYQEGQSPWYDNIEKSMLLNGSFDKLLEDGIRGVTTNPSIFEKAISSSNVYDESIKEFSKKGLGPQEIYDELTTFDVGLASSKLKDIYNNSNNLDGYVSIEVLPEYAYNPKKTIEYAKKILMKIGKPNVMIKIPGTKRGCEAIRELVTAGVSVNATLLFSKSHYEDVAYAYIEGIRQRLKKDMPVYNVASVASLFVSRIDSKIDAMLGELLKTNKDPQVNSELRFLVGKSAVSNMKLIYESYKNLFLLKAFDALKERGAKMQRVLWASTSTKNPSYRDVKYVEELIGPYSINTIPHSTVMAFLDHGNVKQAIEANTDVAKKVMNDLGKFGIDIAKICEELQIEGLDAFQKSFDNLIEAIKRKS